MPNNCYLEAGNVYCYSNFVFYCSIIIFVANSFSLLRYILLVVIENEGKQAFQVVIKVLRSSACLFFLLVLLFSIFSYHHNLLPVIQGIY